MIKMNKNIPIAAIVIVLIAASILYLLSPKEQKNIIINNCEDIRSADERSACFLSLAVNTSDISICSKIPNANEVSRCNRVVTRNSSSCLELKNGFDSQTGFEIRDRDYCLLDFADFFNDKDSCLKVEDVAHRENCITNIAKALSDADFCKNIDDAAGRNACYLEDARFNKDSAICSKISNAFMKDTCLIDSKK